MLGSSVLSDLLRPRPNTGPTVSELQRQVLLPRTAAEIAVATKRCFMMTPKPDET